MIGCPACRAPLSPEVLGAPTFEACADCRTPLRVRLFPAAFRAAAAAPAALAAPGDATCFFHASRRAAVPCADCGRYLCALCDLEIAGRHVCPSCAARRAGDAREDRFVRERTLWDSLALALAVYPMLIFYFSIVTAPAAIFIAIRYWKAPLALQRRSRFRFVVAIVLASLQLLGWIGVFGLILYVTIVGPVQ